MICGIMQPYYFPYIGYFDHISRCDKWVVFDISQYTPRSWMNRNRALHPTQEWTYITANVKKTHARSPMHEIELLSARDTHKELCNKLNHYKGKAPYYPQVMDALENIFASFTGNRLVELNVASLKGICDYLGIKFEPIIASERNYDLPEITHPGQWAVEISALERADMYINPPGGRAIFVPQEFKDRGIRLAFTRVPDFIYKTPRYKFVPNLSILDVMMWNPPEEIRAQFGKAPLDYCD